MKRLLVAILCVSALSPFAYGITANPKLQEKPPPEKKAEKEKKSYDAYVGEYEVAKDFILMVTTDNGKLMARPTGEPKNAEFKPEGEEAEQKFFSSEVNAHLRFAKNEKGEVTGVVVTIEGKDYWAKKIK
jgi:hypothetical protein